MWFGLGGKEENHGKEENRGEIDCELQEISRRVILSTFVRGGTGPDGRRTTKPSRERGSARDWRSLVTYHTKFLVRRRHVFVVFRIFLFWLIFVFEGSSVMQYVFWLHFG